MARSRSRHKSPKSSKRRRKSRSRERRKRSKTPNNFPQYITRRESSHSSSDHDRRHSKNDKVYDSLKKLKKLDDEERKVEMEKFKLLRLRENNNRSSITSVTIDDSPPPPPLPKPILTESDVNRMVQEQLDAFKKDLRESMQLEFDNRLRIEREDWREKEEENFKKRESLEKSIAELKQQIDDLNKQMIRSPNNGEGSSLLWIFILTDDLRGQMIYKLANTKFIKKLFFFWKINNLKNEIYKNSLFQYDDFFHYNFNKLSQHTERATERLQFLEEKRKIIGEKRKLEEELKKKQKEEQKIILNRGMMARPKLSFSLLNNSHHHENST